MFLFLLASILGSVSPDDDADHDGFVALVDCDDQEPGVHPGAVEACDGEDNDCDGVEDLGEVGSWYVDADGDGFGDDATRIASCNPPAGLVANGGDCDDHDSIVRPTPLQLSVGCDAVADAS